MQTFKELADGLRAKYPQSRELLDAIELARWSAEQAELEFMGLLLSHRLTNG